MPSDSRTVNPIVDVSAGWSMSIVSSPLAAKRRYVDCVAKTWFSPYYNGIIEGMCDVNVYIYIKCK